MSELDLLRVAASGMEAQRTTLDLDAHNVAAAQVAGPDGFERLLPRIVATGGLLDGDDPVTFADPLVTSSDAPPPGAVRLDGVSSVHAQADAIGEMVAVLDAQRAFESDASIFDIGKRLAERTIDLGRL